MTSTMSGSRLAQAYWSETRYESLRMLRTPAFAGPFLALPVCLYLLFGVVLFGDALSKDPNGALFMFMGFAVFGVMGPGMFGFGVSIAVERDQGLLRLKRALPMPPAAPLLAKMLMAMLFVAIVMITMIAAAPAGHLRISAGHLLSLTVVNILGAAPFCALGLFIGTWASGKSAPAFVNLLYLPMIYLSGFLIPLPKSMQWVERLSPAYHLHQLALAAIGSPSQGAPLVHALILTGLTLVMTALAVRRLARVG
ncbi:MAG TPA: ABC transporter permease [Bryobacteraceae bacterium]|nr:ABC transporter permease [Bryobacteraceae bacterium]